MKKNDGSLLCTCGASRAGPFVLHLKIRYVKILNMAINVEVTKNGSDNNLSLIRKFTKRVQGSGILSRLRGRRYSQRKLSEYVKQKKTLKKLAEKSRVKELIKMGKMPGAFEPK